MDLVAHTQSGLYAHRCTLAGHIIDLGIGGHVANIQLAVLRLPGGNTLAVDGGDRIPATELDAASHMGAAIHFGNDIAIGHQTEALGRHRIDLGDQITILCLEHLLLTVHRQGDLVIALGIGGALCGLLLGIVLAIHIPVNGHMVGRRYHKNMGHIALQILQGMDLVAYLQGGLFTDIGSGTGYVIHTAAIGHFTCIGLFSMLFHFHFLGGNGAIRRNGGDDIIAAELSAAPYAAGAIEFQDLAVFHLQAKAANGGGIHGSDDFLVLGF